MNRAPIGIFDSGLGGLTVARAIFERLPNESTIYVGDTARVPYGPKSPDTVRRYSLEILSWLLEQGVKAVVVACNTSTAHALETLQEQSPVPVIGVIDPGARAAVAAGHGRIAVIGTAGTIASDAYGRAIRVLEPDAQVVQQPCPLFVPLVEEGWLDHPATELVAREYLEPLRRDNPGALVLGCTHYPLLRSMIQKVVGPDVVLIDSGRETAAVVESVLQESGLSAEPGEARHRFAVSDDQARFRAVGSRFIGERLGGAELVNFES